MKARVKATEAVVEVYRYGKPYYVEYIGDKPGRIFYPEELDLLDNDPDYWARLEHQYAGMAMNALLLTNNIRNGDLEGMKECNTNAMAIAYALIQKLKEKEERK